MRSVCNRSVHPAARAVEAATNTTPVAIIRPRIRIADLPV